ncbi:MAG: hypothetical protein Q9210_001961 [Variospora velana]
MANDRFAVYENLEWAAKFEEYSNIICNEYGGRHSSLSLWQNQNMSTEGIRAMIWFGNASERPVDVFPNDDTPDVIKLTFEVLGGVDFPRLVLSLGVRGVSEVYMEAVFRPWHPVFSPVPNPSVEFAVRDNVDELVGHERVFHFSERMHHLTVESEAKPPNDWNRALKLNGRMPVMTLRWRYFEPVIFERNSPPPPANIQVALNRFRKAVEECDRVIVSFRQIPSIIQDVKLFLAQPIPPPPPWWLFGHRCTPNKPQADQGQDPETVEAGNLVEHKFRIRPRQWWYNSKGHGMGHSPPTSHSRDSAIWDGDEMFELPVLSYYVDVRHFEIIQHCVMMRDNQLATLRKYQQRNTSCDGIHTFRLDMFESLTLSAQQSCVFTVHVGGEPSSKAFPEPSSTVDITLLDDQKIAGTKRFTGEVLDHGSRELASQIRILVVLPAGPGFVIGDASTSWRAKFHFTIQGGQVKKFRRALQILANERPNSWLTQLFLGHRRLSPLTPQAFVSQQNLNHVATMFRLNTKQRLALAAAVTGDFSVPKAFTQARQSICQGAPGTGKSYLIIAVIAYCLRMKLRLMVTAASNQAIAVLVARLNFELNRNNIRGDHQIFHLRTQPMEDIRAIQLRQVIQVLPAPRTIQDAPAQGPWVGQEPTHQSYKTPAGGPTSQFFSRIPPRVRDEITRKLRSRVAGSDESFGLNTYIFKQIEAVQDFVFSDQRHGNMDTQWLVELVRKLYEAESREQSIPLEGLFGGGEDGDTPSEGSSASVWLDIQKEVMRRADVVFVTADSAGHRAATLFHAQLVVIDEASQLKDYQVANATARHLISDSLRRIALLGDQCQLGPAQVISRKNEFSTIGTQGYLQRQITRGQPWSMLTEQYRMHPDIADFVSQWFYSGQLTNHQSVQSQPFDTKWYTFTQRCKYLSGTRQHSIFLDVAGPQTLYRPADESAHSVCNPHTAGTVKQILFDIHGNSDISVWRDVTVITPYAEQTTLLRKSLPSGPGGAQIDIRTVDTAQGDENEVVIVDFVRPGPHMGFVANMRRLCVLFSRAKRVLICVGSAAMGASKGTVVGADGRPAGTAENVLHEYIVRMRARRAVFKTENRNGMCRSMEKSLGGFRKVVT